MRAWLAIVLVACACDRVLGLHGQQLADATPPDAPPSCPVGSPPRYSPIFHSEVVTGCFLGFSASTAAGLFSVNCTSGVAMGTLDHGDVPQSVDIATGSASLIPYGAVLAPGSDDLWVDVRDQPNGTAKLVVFGRSDPTTWTWTPRETLFTLPDDVTLTSAPAFTPAGRDVLAIATPQAQVTLYEFREVAPGTWQRSTVLAPTAMPLYQTPYLSPDGLRMLAVTQKMTSAAIDYASRADPTAAFGALQPVDGTPTVPPNELSAAFMSEDCGRLYIYALDQYLYLQLIY